MGNIRDLIESPIEERFMEHFISVFNKGHQGSQILKTKVAYKSPHRDIDFYPQKKIGDYRVDFLITQTYKNKLSGEFKLVVECDGHDFHEKTKDQAKRDKKRDRFFTTNGYKVLHYTGSEIFKHPDECAHEVINTIAMDFLEVFNEYRKA